MTATQHTSTRPTSSDRRRSPIAAALVALLAVGTTATALSGAAAAAPETSRRVDLATPTFSDPTNITNPLFAIGLDQVVQLGAEGDVALRHDITLLDHTQVIHWDGRDIEAIVSQFVAYGDGEILEVATDYFAQADDGSVWYLGEDVYDYEDGTITVSEGTWLAGRDGPPAMIMAADPEVGQVFRPETSPASSSKRSRSSRSARLSTARLGPSRARSSPRNSTSTAPPRRRYSYLATGSSIRPMTETWRRCPWPSPSTRRARLNR